MKKFIAILTAMLIASLPIAVLADANTITVDKIAVNGSTVTVDFTTNLTEDDQVTLITYEADDSSVAPSSGTIRYIDQIEKGSATSVQFPFATTPNGTYQVKMGGTDINTPSVMMITVDGNMSGTNYFDGHAINVFSDAITAPASVTDQNNDLLILKPDRRYVAAYSTAPAKEGWTVTDCGIRINSVNKEKSAQISLNGASGYGMLFYGSGIAAGQGVVILPYVTYTNNTDSSIVETYYGNTFKTTLTAAE